MSEILYIFNSFFGSQNATDLNLHKEIFHIDLKLLLWMRVLFTKCYVKGLVLECSDCSFKRL